MAKFLRRTLEGRAQFGGRTVARLEVEIFPVSPRLAAGVRLRAGIQRANRPSRPLLRADAQPAELRPLVHREPGIQPGAAERLRWLHCTGVDRYGTHAKCLLRESERANLRNGLPGVWRYAKPRARDGPGCLVF